MKPSACPHCGSVNQIPPHYLGNFVKCTACGGEFKAVEARFATPLPAVPAPPADGPISLWKKSPGCMVLVILLAVGIGLLLFFLIAGATILGGS